MLNLIKMDLYRLLHTISTWVMMVLVIVAAFFCVGLTVDISDRYSNVVSILEMLFHGGLFMVLCSVFVTIFVNAEQRNGYTKNLGGLIKHRYQLVISKIVAVAIEILIAFILFAMATIIATKIFCGNQVAIGSFGSLFSLLGVQYLLHFGFSCVIVLICVLTKSSAFTMVSGILTSFNILGVIYSLINKLIHLISQNADFNISQFMLDYNISTYSLAVPASELFRTIAVGIVFVMISVVCASIAFENRDVL